MSDVFDAFERFMHLSGAPRDMPPPSGTTFLAGAAWAATTKSPYSAGERRLMEILTSLEHKLATKLEKIMSAEDDLNTAVSNIATAVSAAVTDIQSLTAEIAAANTSNDPAIEASVAKLNALAVTLNAAVAPPAPAPTPDPVPVADAEPAVA